MSKLGLSTKYFVGFMPDGIKDTRTNEEKTQDLLDQKPFNAYPDIEKDTLAIGEGKECHIFNGKKWIKMRH